MYIWFEPKDTWDIQFEPEDTKDDNDSINSKWHKTSEYVFTI